METSEQTETTEGTQAGKKHWLTAGEVAYLAGWKDGKNTSTIAKWAKWKTKPSPTQPQAHLYRRKDVEAYIAGRGKMSKRTKGARRPKIAPKPIIEMGIDTELGSFTQATHTDTTTTMPHRLAVLLVPVSSLREVLGYL